MIRRVVAAIGALTLVAPLGTAATAQATSYRYWTYWHGTADAWQFASVGPASSVPADGEVEGWRFAITEGVRGQGQEPRIAMTAAFRQFCGAREAPAGQKRVAVVFDFGETTDAPDGQTPPSPEGTCVVTAQSANGAAILSQAATIRTDRGLVCAIDGYPEGECAPAVSPSAQPRPTTKAPVTTTAGEPTPTRRPKTSAPESSAPSGGTETSAASQEPQPAASKRSSVGTDTDAKEASTPTTTPAAVATQAPATAPTTAAPLPVFVEAEAAVTESPARSWAPLAAVAGLLVAVGGFVWWRRRA